MKPLLFRITILGLLLTAGFAQADLTAVQGRATPGQLLADKLNVLSVTWRIGTTSGHNNGVSSSAPAGIFNPAVTAPGALLTTGGALTRAGTGPFTLTERLTIPGSQVQAWLDSGITRVVIRRQFQDLAAGRVVTGDIAVNLASSGLNARRNTTAELDVQRLRIQLGKQNSAATLVKVDESLQASLTVNYAGNGLLEGKWQIAEPGTTEGKPLYRTLSLVRQPLLKSQESQLKGPVLPTHRPGKYLLRFCVTSHELTEALPGGDTACPSPALTVMAAYQVIETDTPVAALAVTSPRQERVGKETPFSWTPVTGSVLYKLDVFETRGNDDIFVTGVLLPAEQTTTKLTALMQQKLGSGGHYRWQVSAIDPEGHVLARSTRAAFFYKP